MFVNLLVYFYMIADEFAVKIEGQTK